MPNTSTHDAPRAPNPVLAAFARVLESVLDRALDLDPETRAALRPLDGRAVTVDFAKTPFAMRIVVEGDRLAIGPAFAGASALKLSATPAALIGFALARGREGAIVPGTVEVAGDADLARRLEKIATRFSPDIDEAFARLFGEVAGFQIARALRSGLAAVRTSSRAFARDAADYLSEESRDLVAKPEVENFLDDVDALRERADRLDARVRRLARARGKPIA